MTGVRNGVLARGILLDTDAQLIGTVPANATWLLKVVHVLNLEGSAGQVVIQLNSASGQIYARLPTLEVPAADAAIWEGWTALGPGDQLYAQSSSSNCHVWAAGAELPGVLTGDDGLAADPRRVYRY